MERITTPPAQMYNAHVKAWRWYNTFTLPFQRFLQNDLPAAVNRVNRKLKDIQIEQADLKKVAESGQNLQDHIAKIQKGIRDEHRRNQSANTQA